MARFLLHSLPYHIYLTTFSPPPPPHQCDKIPGNAAAFQYLCRWSLRAHGGGV
ncbi:hypothetical protein K440DRAFT_633660 [Wilcoxina mikolae CBS 423.85]|nr:hypothetical protein K440DRAFT_633660 [Wilcoxina mikolae CBS 423.85]